MLKGSRTWINEKKISYKWEESYLESFWTQQGAATMAVRALFMKNRFSLPHMPFGNMGKKEFLGQIIVQKKLWPILHKTTA